MTTSGFRIEGILTFRSGDTIIQSNVKNHWVKNGLDGIATCLMGNYISGATWLINHPSFQSKAYIAVGDDPTVTTENSTTILNEIKCSGYQGSSATKDTSGNYSVVYTGVFGVGVVNQPIEEVGLFLSPYINLTANWISSNSSPPATPAVLCARVSTGDGAFTSFTPSATEVFSVDWEIRVVDA